MRLLPVTVGFGCLSGRGVTGVFGKDRDMAGLAGDAAMWRLIMVVAWPLLAFEP